MVKLRLTKVVSAIILGLVCAAWISHSYSKWGAQGRDAFLTYESGRFDRYMAPNHPLSVPTFASVAVVFFGVALYEGLAMALAKILHDRSAE